MQSTTTNCASCLGSGEAPTDYGPVDCPDCGGSGTLPPRSVLVEWRARDVERALGSGRKIDDADVRWLVAELRAARAALTDIVALAHDVADDDLIGLRIRFTAIKALGLYATSDATTKSASA